MNRQGIGGAAIVVGAAAGVVLGAALLTSPGAYAATLPPSPADFTFPGSPGPWTAFQSFGLYPLYYTSQYETPWTVYDQDTGAVLGNYATEANTLTALFVSNTSVQVVDSTGDAPLAGTLLNTTELGIPVFVGVPGQFDPVQNFYESDPTGAVRDLFQINIGSAAIFGNYFSTGPTGTFDELIFFSNYVVPIIDIPAAGATMAASGADLGDVGTLWSDFAALFA